MTGQVSHKGMRVAGGVGGESGGGGRRSEDRSQEAMGNSSGSVGNLGTVLKAPHEVRVILTRSHEHAIY